MNHNLKNVFLIFYYQNGVGAFIISLAGSLNRHIRFTVMLKRALALDADYLATGHYVRVDTDPLTGKRRLRRGIDRAKDQSYVLHVLNQKQLAHACFPLGPYTKPQVRAMAAERGLSVATKAESQEICFVAQNDYRGFIDRYVATMTEKEPVGAGAVTASGTNGLIQLPKPGPIYDLSGKSLGRHRGLAYYTIGQRKGLGITSPEPLHVLKIDAEQNTLIVGPAEALQRTGCTVGKMHYVSGETPGEPFEALVRIRYKAPEQEAVVIPLEGHRAQVTFSRPQRAITPGQAAVFYGGEDGEWGFGGGIIEA